MEKLQHNLPALDPLRVPVAHGMSAEVGHMANSDIVTSPTQGWHWKSKVTPKSGKNDASDSIDSEG